MGFASLIAYATTGDPGALPFGLDMVNLQNSALFFSRFFINKAISLK